MTIRNILIISEQRADFTTLTAALERADPGGFAMTTVSTLEQPVEAMMDRDNDAVILAHSLETEYLLRLAQKARLATPIVVLIDLESDNLINKLKDAGASDYLVRGMLTDDLIHRVLDYSISLKGVGHGTDTGLVGEQLSSALHGGAANPAEVAPLRESSLRGSGPIEQAVRQLDEVEPPVRVPDPELEAEFEPELELESPLILEPAADPFAGIDFDTELELHPASDDAEQGDVELDLELELERELELEPLSSSAQALPELSEELPGQGDPEALAGPIAEALEALRAEAPTAPMAQYPLESESPSSAETPHPASIEKKGGAAAALARQGPMLVLVCILLLVVGMLGAGVFRLNDTLSGLEQRLLNGGTIARASQQPVLSEELWIEMRQRNEELAARLDQLQAQIAAEENTAPVENSPVLDTMAETENQDLTTAETATAAEEALSPLEVAIAEAVAAADERTESGVPAAGPAGEQVDAGKFPPLADSPAPGWFINMGSFGSYEAAGQWASTLDPGPYQVEVSVLSRDGQDLFRVRIVGIEDRLTARNLAQRFQRELYLNQLWVGKY